MAKKKTKSNPYFNILKSYSEVLKSQINGGESIFYVRDSLLPILNVKILVKERSREELSDIDLMLFKLIQQGITSVQSIVRLTGLAEKLVQKHLTEMVGRSFLVVIGEQLKLTELGEESLEHGVPIRTVQRAFRYCAVSEQLLPREAYNLPYTEINNLRSSEFGRSVKNSHILEETQLVNLKGMDLSKVKSKRDLGITDEALEFGEILGYSSGFLQTRMFLVGRKSPERAIVAFGKTCKDYPLEDIQKSIPALQDTNIAEKYREFSQEQINRGYVSFGEGEISVDEFGLLIVTISKGNQDWLSKALESGKQGILLCGSKTQVAMPVGIKAWGKYSNLTGLTVRYKLLDEEAQYESSVLRNFIEKLDAYMETPREERIHGSFTKHIEATLVASEIEIVRFVAEKYKVSRVIKNLPKQSVVTD